LLTCGRRPEKKEWKVTTKHKVPGGAGPAGREKQFKNNKIKRV